MQAYKNSKNRQQFQECASHKRWSCPWGFNQLLILFGGAHASCQRGCGFESRRVLGFFSSFSLKWCILNQVPHGGVTLLIFLKNAWPCSLRWSKLYMHRLSKKTFWYCHRGGIIVSKVATRPSVYRFNTSLYQIYCPCLSTVQGPILWNFTDHK